MALYAFAMMFFDATKDIKEKHQNPILTIILGTAMSVRLCTHIFSTDIGKI